MFSSKILLIEENTYETSLVCLPAIIIIAWKVSLFSVFSGPNAGKHGPEKLFTQCMWSCNNISVKSRRLKFHAEQDNVLWSYLY